MSGMSRTRVLGYVMARNEWPVLGISIVHAFGLGIDQVIVVDHQSNDDTQDGLRNLQNHYGDRLVVYCLDEYDFYQEATTAMVMELVDAQSFDWVYVFDADEFLLIPKESSLADSLEIIPPHVDAVRYEVHNWVAPSDFNHLNLSEYSRLINRATPNYFVDIPGEVLSQEIISRNINYFDIPFGTKIIVRGQHANKLSAGSHSLALPNNLIEFVIDDATIRAGHLPFLSRDRLMNKCSQGQALIETGFTFEHGWQSQMLNRVQEERQLESFWDCHSMPVDGRSHTSGCGPVTIIDEALKCALNFAVTQLCQVKRLNQSTVELDNYLKSQIVKESIDSIAIRCIHEQIELRGAITADRDLIVANRNAIMAERDALVEKLGLIVSERDQLVAELQASRGESDALVENLRQQIIVLRTRLQRINKSRSLRFGLFALWPLRKIKEILRRSRG